jgi:ADP-ribose pyrophosphatase YjhB (NUDIX family)
MTDERPVRPDVERLADPHAERLADPHAALDRGPDARSTDIASGRGVPDWISATLRYCSRCGSELRFGPLDGEDRDRSSCLTCGHITYVNPRLVVTVLPVTDDGEVILIRRGIEPGLGAWAQPGGFLEVDETITEAARREALEETGLRIEPGEVVGFYTRLEAAVVVLVLEARIVGGTAAPTVEATEIRSFHPASLPWPGLAFKTTYWALVDWLARRHPELEAPAFPGDRPG